MQVPKNLIFKTMLRAKPFLHEKKNHFHINGFALSLALKKGLAATRKWQIKVDLKSIHNFSYENSLQNGPDFACISICLTRATTFNPR